MNPAFELKVKDAEFGSSIEQQERMKAVDLPTQTGQIQLVRKRGRPPKPIPGLSN